MRRTLSGRGKRLRPLLALLAAECAGRATDRTVRFAAVAKVVHTASLVHDDVVDGALSRRGRRSAKAAWGNKVSVLLGDYLIARAFISLAEHGGEDLALELAQVARHMCDGQILEMRLAGRLISEESYLRIARAKTGALFGLCAKTGALTGGGSEEMARSLQTYGESFGLAFQISDDILDLVGTNGRSGKAQGKDLAERKLTLPLLLAARERGVRMELQALPKKRRDHPPDRPSGPATGARHRALESPGRPSTPLSPPPAPPSTPFPTTPPSRPCSPSPAPTSPPR